jgi:hypothetical protein
VAEAGRRVDHDRAGLGADEVVLLGVSVQQRGPRFLAGQPGQPGRDRRHPGGQVGRQVTGVDRGAQHRPEPAFPEEPGPPVLRDGPVVLRQQAEEPARAVEPEPFVAGLVQGGQGVPDGSPVRGLAGLGRPLRERLVQQQQHAGSGIDQAAGDRDRDPDGRGPADQPQARQFGGELLAGIGAELGEHREWHAAQDPAGVRRAVVQAGEAPADPAAAPMLRPGPLDRGQHIRLQQRMSLPHDPRG